MGSYSMERTRGVYGRGGVSFTHDGCMLARAKLVARGVGPSPICWPRPLIRRRALMLNRVGCCLNNSADRVHR